LGTVFLVGAGPGDPELITLKGLELLKTCDVVIYDRLASFQLLDYLKDGCQKIYVGKAAGQHSKTQEEINAIIVQNAQRYESIVRLKGGDSFVFGRGGEEIEELIKHNISFEVVPGVTSAISVPESVGIPVTHRGVSQSFHVITGHTNSSQNVLTDNFEALAKLEGTLVFLMGLSNIEQIVERLVQNGKDVETPVAVISNGTMNNEKTLRGTLADIVTKVKEENIVSPAIIVIGKTARLEFSSKMNKPISGLKVGITGTKEIREKLERGLSKLGAKVYSLCDMHVVKTDMIYQFESELYLIENYQWILFTSQNAIKIFFEKMNEQMIDRRRLNHAKFAVVGMGTKKALQKYGYIADFIPSKFTTKTLAEELSKIVEKEDNLLIPRAFRGSEELIDIFTENNVKFKEIPIYDVVGNITENIEYISEMDCLAFASASGVSAFFEGIDEKGINEKEINEKGINEKEINLQDNLKIACIGDVTATEIRKFNKVADIVSVVNDIDGLVLAIGNYTWN